MFSGKKSAFEENMEEKYKLWTNRKQLESKTVIFEFFQKAHLDIDA
jgi:hypothetical protein